MSKQTLESEKNELTRQVEDLRNKLSELNEHSREERDVRAHGRTNPRDLKSLYTEELDVARDAIANLRNSFNMADPNQHILDTLEQCVHIIVEKILSSETFTPGNNFSQTGKFELSF